MPRTVNDAVLTAGSKMVVSPTADFTFDDLRVVVSTPALPPGTRIWAVSSASVAQVTRPALESVSEATLTIGVDFESGVINLLTDLRAQIETLTKERHNWLELRSRTWAEAHDKGMTFASLADASRVSETLVRREAGAWRARV